MGYFFKILSYPISVFYYIVFALLLVIFHPIQWLCLKIGGYNAHRISVAILNLGLVRALHILGTNVSFKITSPLPENTPIIFVANHQSLNDIPAMIWFLRAHHPKFVSKKELGKGIPSVSFNLKYGGSALIDRKNSAHALKTLKKFGKYIEKNNYSAVIFPEGTRSRGGVPKRFSTNGLKTMLKHAPSAVLVPITVNNSYKFLKYKGFPMLLGVHLQFKVHAPVAPQDKEIDTVLEEVEFTIKRDIIQS
ncbi:lysophospholipid acyltransferase family protein [Urechidicola sp. KH5]